MNDKEKELIRRVDALENIVEIQSLVIDKCYDIMLRILESQEKVILAVGSRKNETEKSRT